MRLSRIRRSAPKVAAFAYAGYKWFEDHTDEVENWSAKAIERSRGKQVAKFVVPAAHVAMAGVKWFRENDDEAKKLAQMQDTDQPESRTTINP